MDINLTKFLFWFGFVVYLLLALLYINYIRLDIIDGVYTSKFYYKFIITIGFLLLSINSIQSAIKQEKTNINMIYKYDLSNVPSYIGFTLLTLYFCLIFNKSNHIFYILAPIGYMFLASKQHIGLYLVMLFYLISLGYHILDFANTDYFVMMTKILLCVYYGIYIYANIIKNIKNKNTNILLV